MCENHKLTKRGTVIGQEGRSISVRYGEGVTDILLIRPCDFHDAPTNEGAAVELRYVDHGNIGAWWHAYPVSTTDFSDLEGDFDREYVAARSGIKPDLNAELARQVTGGHDRSTSAIRRFRCTGCNGTGKIAIYRRGMGWGQTPEVRPCWKGCGGTGLTRTDPETLKLQRQRREDKKAQEIARVQDAARAFKDANPDIKAWFHAELNTGRTVWEFAESLHAQLMQKGFLSQGQIDAIRRNIEKKAAKAQGLPVAGLDLTTLPSGMYAVPGGDTRLKLRVSRGKKGGSWAGVIFVDDGAVYGQRQSYGRQLVGKAYQGAIETELRAIVADPKAAMAAYGHLVGRCGMCGRPLEDAESLARGIGPVCARKAGW